MLVWIALAVMTGAAVLAVLWPLSRTSRGPSVDVRATDRAFYEAQIAEIDRDRERGLLDPFEANGAKVEAARRLLAADRLEREVGAGKPVEGRRKAASVLAIVGVPLVSLALYLSIGHPELPGQPLATRTDGVNEAGGLDEAVQRIEQHLAKNPDDGRGYEVLGPVYLSTGRYEDAVRAYSAAVRLLGDAPARLENYAEALVAANEGVVSAEARKVIDRALALEPRLIKARYFKAVAAEQDGDKPAAAAIYRDLANDAPAGSALAVRLNERLNALGSALPAAPAPTPGVPAGPAAAAIAAMPKGDQLAAIRGMVENLSAKLELNGADVEGWLRLVRSYSVLGEADKARDALARGRAALAGDPQGLGRLDALGRELAIGGS
jgi:cytochrome c-type biogenesis protein CcmH